MSFSSGFSGNQDNEEFMQALDKVYNAPQFNRKAFSKICTNTAKTAKIGGNDYNCTANLEKLFLECERLADIAVQKSNQLNEMKEQVEQLEKQKGSKDVPVRQDTNTNQQLIQAQHEIKSKDAEIVYLQSQLRKKEEENRQLQNDKQKLLQDQLKNQNKNKLAQQNKEDYALTLNTQNIDDKNLERVLYKRYNQDLKQRLKFVSRILNWQAFGDEISSTPGDLNLNEMQNEQSFIADGEFANEHFTFRQCELTKVLHKVYFPEIDCQEHDNMYSSLDFTIRLEHEKLHDMILVELITLQGVLQKLGYDSSINTPGGAGLIENCKVNEHERMIIGGLMKRLLNQVPVKISGTNISTQDFQSKVSNLYMLLKKRVSMKNIFEVSLNVNMQKAHDEVDMITERILSLIMDYDSYCEEQESQIKQKLMTPQKILNIFQRKIQQKMMTLNKNFKAQQIKQDENYNTMNILSDKENNRNRLSNFESPGTKKM